MRIYRQLLEPIHKKIDDISICFLNDLLFWNILVGEITQGSGHGL